MTISTTKRSQRQENRVADLLDGTRNAGSGNGWVRKNDVRTDRYSIELKTTEKGSYSLKAKELETAEKYALIDGRIMLFGIEMGGRTWYVLSEEDFLALHTNGTI